MKIQKIKYKACIRPHAFQYVGFNQAQLENIWNGLLAMGRAIGGKETYCTSLGIRELKTDQFLLRKLERSFSLVSISLGENAGACPIEKTLLLDQLLF